MIKGIDMRMGDGTVTGLFPHGYASTVAVSLVGSRDSTSFRRYRFLALLSVCTARNAAHY